MAWGQRSSWNATAPVRPPWQQARKPRGRREPSWKEINQLSQQIDVFMATAKGNADSRGKARSRSSAEASEDGRLAQLKQMRAAATFPTDQKYLDAQITDLMAQKNLKLPIHDRLKLAKERKEAADDKVERNREHVKKAKASLQAALTLQARCYEEMEALRTEIAAGDEHGRSDGSGQPSESSAQLLQLASQALQQVATMASANNGRVQFDEQLYSNLQSVIGAIPATTAPATRNAAEQATERSMQFNMEAALSAYDTAANGSEDENGMDDESLPDLENDTVQSLLADPTGLSLHAKQQAWRSPQSQATSSTASTRGNIGNGPFRVRRHPAALVDPYHTPKERGRGARDRAASG